MSASTGNRERSNAIAAWGILSIVITTVVAVLVLTGTVPAWLLIVIPLGLSLLVAFLWPGSSP
jgi:hypothetical protein